MTSYNIPTGLSTQSQRTEEHVSSRVPVLPSMGAVLSGNYGMISIPLEFLRPHYGDAAINPMIDRARKEQEIYERQQTVATALTAGAALGIEAAFATPEDHDYLKGITSSLNDLGPLLPSKELNLLPEEVPKMLPKEQQFTLDMKL